MAYCPWLRTTSTCSFLSLLRKSRPIWKNRSGGGTTYRKETRQVLLQSDYLPRIPCPVIIVFKYAVSVWTRFGLRELAKPSIGAFRREKQFDTGKQDPETRGSGSIILRHPITLFMHFNCQTLSKLERSYRNSIVWLKIFSQYGYFQEECGVLCWILFASRCFLYL